MLQIATKIHFRVNPKNEFLWLLQRSPKMNSYCWWCKLKCDAVKTQKSESFKYALFVHRVFMINDHSSSSVELLSCIQPDLKARKLIQQSYTTHQYVQT